MFTKSIAAVVCRFDSVFYYYLIVADSNKKDKAAIPNPNCGQ